MHPATLLAVITLFVVQCNGSVQLQMPDAAELQQPDNDLQAQIKELQKNVSEVWNYIYELRSAVSHHLTHLRQHQVELETSMHNMEHLHESSLKSSSMHHHSDEHHSHSDEHHSHGDEHHSHGDEHHSHGDEHHSHGDEHSHGSDHNHGSMEDHSHSGEQHSHSGEHHHSDEHGHHSHSYSHSSHDHSKEDAHSHGDHNDHHDHGHDHKDSHETEDLQQAQKVDPVAEPIVTATTRQDEHHHQHHHHQSFSSDKMNLLSEHHHHDHRHDSSTSIRNRTVVLPKYSEYGLYDLALCRVQPNSDLPDGQKRNIYGTITMWQKKTGGPLNFHVRLQGFDVGDHHSHHQQTIQTEEDNETPKPVSHTHGFHIHAYGDLSTGCGAAGPHYNPRGVNHGKPGPDALSRHVGDLGNIQCDEHGNTNIVFSDEVASLGGQYSVIGKSIVIHADEDDLGLGGDAESLKTGNAGARLACCTIQSTEKIPIWQYKFMKTAAQRKINEERSL